MEITVAEGKSKKKNIRTPPRSPSNVLSKDLTSYRCVWVQRTANVKMTDFTEILFQIIFCLKKMVTRDANFRPTDPGPHPKLSTAGLKPCLSLRLYRLMRGPAWIISAGRADCRAWCGAERRWQSFRLGPAKCVCSGGAESCFWIICLRLW